MPQIKPQTFDLDNSGVTAKYLTLIALVLVVNNTGKDDLHSTLGVILYLLESVITIIIFIASLRFLINRKKSYFEIDRKAKEVSYCSPETGKVTTINLADIERVDFYKSETKVKRKLTIYYKSRQSDKVAKLSFSLFIKEFNKVEDLLLTQQKTYKYKVDYPLK